MPRLVQGSRFTGVNTPLGDDVLVFYRMTASEELGRLFKYDLELLSEDPALNLDDLLGQNVTVRLEMGEGTRYFNGFVSRCSQAGARGRLMLYEVTLRPWTWFLTRTADCRIFQEMTVPDIIKEVFRDHGFTDFEEALSGSYKTWENCVQYRETDFNFISRLMEHEGLYYYYKHDNGKHTMVLADSYSAHEKTAGYEEIPYFPPDDQARRERDHIYDWNFAREVRSGAYALNDFDFKVPKKSLSAVSSVSHDHAASDFEIYDYPGTYVESADGDAYADVRIQETQTRYERANAVGNARGLMSGGLFSLTDFPREDQNREYLIVSAGYELQSDEYQVESSVSAAEEFVSSLQVMDARTPFRTARTTRKPVIQGPQTAVVVGPSGDEIHTDEFGRVKLHFHWDRYSQADENSSCWVRVSQSWAGKKWGAIYLPRIGQEVIVEFLEGDPDRPLITGRVYNGDNRPPYALPDNKTISTLKSNTSKGGGGFNELRFEDKSGEEQIYLHAQKNFDIRVVDSRFETVGGERNLVVEGDLKEHIKASFSNLVDADESREVKGKRSLKVTGDVAEKYGADHSEVTTGDVFVKGANVILEAGTNITLKVGGSSVAIEAGGITVKTSGTLELEGASVNIKGSASLNAEAPTTTVKGAGTATVDGGGALTLKGGVVKIN